MPIRYVLKKQFASFGAPRANEAITEEVEWFADDSGAVLGVISRDRASPNYAITVLGRDEHDGFRVLDTATEIVTVDEARRQLFANMEKHLATGAKNFPRGD